MTQKIYNQQLAFKDLVNQGGSEGREDFQRGWHIFFEKIRCSVPGSTVLDVGAGLCHSKTRIQNVTTQDLAPDLKVDIKEPIHKIKSNSYDWVTAFDVIEHVIVDKVFMANLRRICRIGLFLTTPNGQVSKCKNFYHIREYSPKGFDALIPPAPQGVLPGKKHYYFGDSEGTHVIQVDPPPTETEHPHQAILWYKPSYYTCREKW